MFDWVVEWNNAMAAGGRTGEEGNGENRISQRRFIYYGLDSKADAYGMVILYDSYGNNMKIPITIEKQFCKDDPEAAFMKIVESFDTIINADPKYFIPLFNGSYEVQVLSGTDLASIYNIGRVEKATILGGMHSPDNTISNKATIYIAGEVLSENARYGYFVGKFRGHNTTVPFRAWEVIAHEFGHQLDFLEYGLMAYLDLPPVLCTLT